jgi:hypothetical protein
MAELLLDQIHSQVRERVLALEPAACEYERLEAALTALGGLDDAPVPSAPATSQPRTAKRQPRPSAPTSGKRAPRGANRAATLAALADRPGASASELSAASGVGKPVLYALLKTLEEQGEVAKEDLPSGTAGYRLAPASSGESAGVWRTAPDAS